MISMAIKGVLFDKDGTLIDVTGTWVPAYRPLLCDVFPGWHEDIGRKVAAAWYDPGTGSFRAGSLLAGGSTRDLVEVWWPGLDATGGAEKIHLLDVVYRDLALANLQ